MVLGSNNWKIFAKIVKNSKKNYDMLSKQENSIETTGKYFYWLKKSGKIWKKSEKYWKNSLMLIKHECWVTTVGKMHFWAQKIRKLPKKS